MAKMYVLIENNAEGKYTASLIGWPALKAQGDTEDEALTQLRQSFTTRIRQAKIVAFDLEVIPTENPWLQLGQRFKGNPLLDEVEEAITEYRRQLDAVPDKP